MSKAKSNSDADLAAALREALKPRGVVSAWPAFDDPDDDWQVGVAFDLRRRPFRVTAADIDIGNMPGRFQPLAVVRTREAAEALAALLNGGRA